MVEDRRVVQVVFQYCETVVSLTIYLTEKLYPFLILLELGLTEWTDMTIFDVFSLHFLELFATWHTRSIKVSPQTTCHTKVIHKKWMLIDMLKDAEFALFQRQLNP